MNRQTHLDYNITLEEKVGTSDLKLFAMPACRAVSFFPFLIFSQATGGSPD
jgi:hypothetical protein